jgi:DNA-binding transcriptional MerR regulator
MADELLTIGEVAERVRTPVNTLRYWRSMGEGPPSFKVGRRVLYRTDDVEVWLNEQRAHARLH